MKKAIGMALAAALVVMMFPASALAEGSASFSVSGPGTLSSGETGTYSVSVTLSDAAAAQATLAYDSAFFELVSGNVNGVTDYAANQNTTVTLITVQLKCVAGAGSSGTIFLSEIKAARLTGSPTAPVGSVPCSGGSKTVACVASIGSVAITGIDVPTAGAAPDTTASATPTGVTAGAVTWSPTVTTAFGHNTVYTASVTLTAGSGYAFASAATATVNGVGATSVTQNSDGTLTVTYAFPATGKQPIDSVAITGITAPAAGAAPDTTASVATAGVTAGAITWSPSVTTAFGYNTVYTASVTLTADSGYAFASGVTATVNGNAASATLNGDGTLSVTYAFAATDLDTPVITAQPQDKAVAVGGEAALSVTASASGTLSYQWYGNTANSNSGGTPIADATSSAYSAPTTTVGTMYYYCVVTNTDKLGIGGQPASAASDAAKVVVKRATIQSNTYSIDQTASILSEVTLGTTVDQLKAKLLNDAEDIKLFDRSGAGYTDNAVMTGMTVKLIINGIERDRLQISVFGDVTGDGLIDVNDIVYIRSYILGTYSMSGEVFLAADINEDEDVDISDILYIRAHILKTYTISAK